VRLRLLRRLAELEDRVAALEAARTWELSSRYDLGVGPVDGQALWREASGEYAHYIDTDTDEFGGYL
jgi:hypothetical protein